MSIPMESESIDKLAEALAKAQGTMEAAKQDSLMVGEKYSFKYASLAAVHAAIRGPLSANGLAYTQVLDQWEPGKLILITTLMHVSGQFVRSIFPLPPAGGNMQAFGSALTYAKRYSIAAMIGIASDEDDDGQAASKGGNRGTNNSSQRSQPTPPSEAGHRQPPASNGSANGNGHKPAAPPPAPVDWSKTHSDDGNVLLINQAMQAEINKTGLAKCGQKAWLSTARPHYIAVVAPEAKGKLERLTVLEGKTLLDTINALGSSEEHSEEGATEGA